MECSNAIDKESSSRIEKNLQKFLKEFTILKYERIERTFLELTLPELES